MGRAGWTLWLAYDLGGSYEEVPSTLLEEMKRDRRWCQGNLQHLRLLFTEGLFGAHRALFLNGVLSYVSALLWFAFLTLSTARGDPSTSCTSPTTSRTAPSLFPEWPIWRPDWALCAARGHRHDPLPAEGAQHRAHRRSSARSARAYGGVVRLTLSVLLEILLSSLLAPIRMVFHSRFVVQNLLGRTVTWRSQEREDAETSWREAIRHHGFDTLFASAWGTALYCAEPELLLVGDADHRRAASFRFRSRSAPAASASATARAARGSSSSRRRASRRRAATICDANLRAARGSHGAVPGFEGDGFVRAAVDPYVNALHRALLGPTAPLRAAIRAAPPRARRAHRRRRAGDRRRPRARDRAVRSRARRRAAPPACGTSRTATAPSAGAVSPRRATGPAETSARGDGASGMVYAETSRGAMKRSASARREETCRSG